MLALPGRHRRVASGATKDFSALNFTEWLQLFPCSWSIWIEEVAFIGKAPL